MAKKPLQKKKAKPEKQLPWYLDYIGLGLLVVGAYLSRVLGQLDKVFTDYGVFYREVDGWYHLRLVDATIRNFPSFMRWDMFAQYPDGASVGYMPLMTWLMALCGPHYETVTPFLPPTFAALAMIPTFFIAKRLFGRRVAIIAPLVLMLMPGEFFHRTLLGFIDHHAIEALTMVTTFCLILYGKDSKRRIWPIAAGISMGLYQLSWAGSGLFILALAVWVWWEFLSRLSRNEDFFPVVRMISIPMLISLIMSFYYSTLPTQLLTLMLALGTGVLWLLPRIFKSKEKLIFGLTATIPVGMAASGVFVNWFNYLSPIFWGGGNVIQEASFITPEIIIKAYGLAFILAFGGLWFYRKGDPLFIVWSVVLLIAAMGQRRWGYYTAIPVSLLAAYTAVHVTKWVAPITRTAVIVVIVAFMIIPNATQIGRITTLQNNIQDDWYQALTWLGENTPEPFDTPDAYHLVDNTEKPKYGVLNWWDYGHWIIRIAHRVPTESPTQTSFLASEFFTARTEEEANEWLEGYNIPYAILDEEMMDWKWYALLTRAEDDIYADPHKRFAWTLWKNEAKTWKLIHRYGRVRIYERIQP